MSRIVLLAAFVFFGCPRAPAQGIKDLCKKIRQASSDILEKPIRSGGQRFDDEFTSRDLTEPPGRQILHQYRSTYLTDYKSDSYLMSKVQVGGSVRDTNNYCIGINPDYCFELSKKQPDSSWVVRKLQVTDDPDLDTQKFGFSTPLTRPSRWPKGASATIVYGLRREPIDYSKLDTRPDAAVKAITTNPAGMVVIAYETDGPPETQGRAEAPARVRNELTLDPGHDYLAVDFKQDYSAGNTQNNLRHSWDYQFDGELVKRVVSTHSVKVTAGGVMKSHGENVTVVDYKYGPIPAREFTLSAFGFPEPPGLPERDTGWPTYVWALIVAGVCAAIIGVIRWRKSRA